MSENTVPISVCYADYKPDFVEEPQRQISERDPQDESPSQPIVQESTKNKENEHQKYIDRLAKPKKPFPGGPIRENIRPKTIAFGKTINVSQCIEGAPAKNLKLRKENMDRPPLATHHENGQGEEQPVVKKTSAPPKTSPRVTESKVDPVQDVVARFEAMLHERDQQMKDVQAQLTELRTMAVVPHDPTSGASYRYTNDENELLRSLNHALQRNPNFAKAVLTACREHLSRTEQPAFQGVRRSMPNPQRNNQRNWNEPEGSENRRQDNYQRNSTVTEKITLERSYQKDYPYSVDSRRFLERRPPSPHRQNDYGQHSTYRDGMSIAVQPERRHYRSPSPRLELPRSTYRAGQSVAFAPSSANVLHDFDDFSDGASEHNISHPDFDELDEYSTPGPADKSQRQAERKARMATNSSRR